MARLIGLKRKDENRYRTFSNVSSGTSNDNLAFRTMANPKKAFISPAVHKTTEKGSQLQNKKPRKRKRWISWTCCYNRKRIKGVVCCPCLYFFYVCCKRKNNNLNNDDDVDKAVEEYRQRQGISETSGQGSTLQSDKGASHFWSWDESWKSNSDKFLESLELDCVGSDKSLKRKLRQRNSKVRVTAFNRFCGGGSRSFSFVK